MSDQLALKNHFSLTSADDVKQICSPLFQQTDIAYFRYYRSYNDGSRVCLATNPTWTAHFFEKGCYKTAKMEKHASTYQSGYALWDHWEPTTISGDLKNQFKMGHGLTIVKALDDHVEVCDFTTSPDNTMMNHFYLNHLAVMNAFVDYFKSEADDLLKQGEKTRIQLPKNAVSQFEEDGSMLQNNKTIDAKELMSTFHPEIRALSERQQQCLSLLAQGLTAKQIAKELGLSFRTIEFYLSNIKIKLGCKTKAELIQLTKQWSLT